MSVVGNTSSTKESDVKIMKANYMLQAKVGAGPLDQKVVERCQSVMDNNEVDFTPMAKQYLEELLDAIKKAKVGEGTKADLMAAITAPVMQLKANASLFNYGLIGSLANVMLSFLEAIKEFDANVLAIVEAHHTTLSAIVSNKMSGTGGQYGQQMEEELKSACKRYFTKKKPA